MTDEERRQLVDEALAAHAAVQEANAAATAAVDRRSAALLAAHEAGVAWTALASSLGVEAKRVEAMAKQSARRGARAAAARRSVQD